MSARSLLCSRRKAASFAGSPSVSGICSSLARRILPLRRGVLVRGWDLTGLGRGGGSRRRAWMHALIAEADAALSFWKKSLGVKRSDEYIYILSCLGAGRQRFAVWLLPLLQKMEQFKDAQGAVGGLVVFSLYDDCRVCHVLMLQLRLFQLTCRFHAPHKAITPACNLLAHTGKFLT